MSVRIMHGVINIAGIPGNLARAERAIGQDASSVCFPNAYGFATDVALGRKPPAEEFGEALERYDVFNLHFGHGFFGQNLADHDFLKRAGKRVNLFFHGCDVRQSKTIIGRAAFSGCHACWPMACNANSRAIIDWAERYADAVLVSTPDLLEFIEGSRWLPQAIDLSSIAPAAPLHKPIGSPIRLVHAPTAAALKGTVHIVAAVERLREMNVPVELVLVQGRQHADVLAAIAGADAVIDQCLFGFYGMIAVEAMALKKPALCYLREDLLPIYPNDLPVQKIDPGSLENDILAFIDRRDEWDAIGRAGQEYVRRYHASEVIARSLDTVYQHPRT